MTWDVEHVKGRVYLTVKTVVQVAPRVTQEHYITVDLSPGEAAELAARLTRLSQ